MSLSVEKDSAWRCAVTQQSIEAGLIEYEAFHYHCTRIIMHQADGARVIEDARCGDFHQATLPSGGAPV